MTWKTHVIGGIQAGLLVATATGADLQTAAVEITAAAIGSILPDIDHPQSKISRSDLGLTLVSNTIARFTKHRRATHTVWCSFLFALLAFGFLSLISATHNTLLLAGLSAAVILDLARLKIGSIVALITLLFGPVIQDIPAAVTIAPEMVWPCTVAVFFGCIAHLVYDTFNPQGIMWLHPFKKKRYSIGNIQTESSKEPAFAIAMLVLTILIAIPTYPKILGALKLPRF